MKLMEQMRIAVADRLSVSAEVSIRYEKWSQQVVILNGENVNQYIRTEEVGNMASKSICKPGGKGTSSQSSERIWQQEERCCNGWQGYWNR